MATLIGFAIQLVLGSLILFGALKVVDSQNQKNTLGAAAGWSLVLAIAGLMPLFGPIFGLVVLFMVCFRYYELGVLQSIGVLLVEIGIAIGAAFTIAALTVAAHPHA